MKSFLASFALLVAFVAQPGPAQPSSPPSPDRAQVLSAAREVMKVARHATLITVSDEGQPQARIVDPTELDSDLIVWIGTNPSTRKVAQLRKNPRATLFYFDPSTQAQVTLLGSASLVSDPEKKERHRQSRWAPYYPNGPRSDDLILIRFVPRIIEIASTPHKLLNDPQTWRPVILELK